MSSHSTNLEQYQRCYDNFDWPLASQHIHRLPSGGLNIAYEAVDSHLHDGLAEKVAIRWIAQSGNISELSYRDLAQDSSRFASALRTQLHLNPGDKVFSLLGRVPQLYISALGTLKAGLVFTPLFSAFGPEPIRSRMEIGSANVLITTKRLFNKKVAHWYQELSHLKKIIIIDGDNDLSPNCHRYDDLIDNGNPDFTCYDTRDEDTALLHFTSGTTGKPKGVIHVHDAVTVHIMSAYYALDLHQSDIYWCTADPGWVTGTTYGIIAPLCHGVTMIVDEAEFNPDRWYRILQQQQVTVWYTAPTAIRLLMKAGSELLSQYQLDKLRFMASVGEPLNPEAVIWSEKTFGHPFHDNWWQTETGGIMIANFAGEEVKPGSMGRALPGIKAAIVIRDDNGELQASNKVMQVGELALASGWPSMFRGYLNQQDKYNQCFENGWYLSGDLAKQDEDGYFWFVGRADDLIKSSGHLIGPFEVENSLMEHEAVTEAAVIGIPDPVAGEIVKAFVTLKPGFDVDDVTRKKILGHARKQLGAAVAPKIIEFRENLPKTRSGKIMRRLLKARELHLPEGDISTLESDEK